MASEDRQQEPDYRNWVSWKILVALGLVAVVLFALSSLFIHLLIDAVIALVGFVFFAKRSSF